MKSEALKKAQSKYRREKITSLKIDLYIKDSDIADYLATLPNKQGYVKELIRADMQKDI